MRRQIRKVFAQEPMEKAVWVTLWRKKSGNSESLPALPGATTTRNICKQVATGGVQTARKRPAKRQTAFENIRCPLSFAALAESLYKSGVLPERIYVFDDIAVHVSPQMDAKPRVLTDKQVKEEFKARNVASGSSEKDERGKTIRITDIINWEARH